MFPACPSCPVDGRPEMAKLLTPIIYVLAFIAMVLAVQGIAAVVFSSLDRKERTNRRLTLLASGMTHSEVYATLVRKPLDQMGTNSKLVKYYNWFANYCRQAGLTESPLRLVSMVGLSSVALWLFSVVLLRSGDFETLITSAVFGLPGSTVICGLVFFLWLRSKRSARMRLFEQQMPLALDVVNRALRAGHPVISAVRLAADEMGDPIGSEFGIVVDETTYGFEFRDAMVNFARRCGLADAQFFAVTVGIQAETGGNLAEVLEGLAVVIRNRATLAKRVRALSSEGRASATMLTILPIVLTALMMMINPTYYSSKFSDPIFVQIVSVVFVSYLIGIFAMHRIINFKY
jgi:tight adherence protein B